MCRRRAVDWLKEHALSEMSKRFEDFAERQFKSATSMELLNWECALIRNSRDGLCRYLQDLDTLLSTSVDVHDSACIGLLLDGLSLEDDLTLHGHSNEHWLKYQAAALLRETGHDGLARLIAEDKLKWIVAR